MTTSEEAQRLDVLQGDLWEKALTGDARAVEVVLKALERRARMLGLDLPGKTVEVVICGCAECHGWGEEPLIEVRSFESVGTAEAWAAGQGWLGPDPRWLPHPQGGEHVVVGQGFVWIRS
jgi:hypothetical protein